MGGVDIRREETNETDSIAQLLDPAMLEAGPTPGGHESVSSLYPSALSWALAFVAEGSLSENRYEQSAWEGRRQSH